VVKMSQLLTDTHLIGLFGSMEGARPAWARPMPVKSPMRPVGMAVWSKVDLW